MAVLGLESESAVYHFLYQLRWDIPLIDNKNDMLLLHEGYCSITNIFLGFLISFYFLQTGNTWCIYNTCSFSFSASLYQYILLWPGKYWLILQLSLLTSHSFHSQRGLWFEWTVPWLSDFTRAECMKLEWAAIPISFTENPVLPLICKLPCMKSFDYSNTFHT